MHPMPWIIARDPGLAALRRAGRTAIVMPGMFAFGDKVLGNPTLATFAAFGSFAMLLLVDFTGPMRDRLQAQAALAAVGAVFIGVGTLASRQTWTAVAAMIIVGFGVLFAGVVSSVLAGATTSLLLAFILPVSVAGPISSIPDRLAGWGLASVAAWLAVVLLWPAPTRDPLRLPAVHACRALSERLRLDVALAHGGEGGPSEADHDGAVAAADASVTALRRVFFATPFRPTGLSTGARAVVRLVDELSWIQAIIVTSAPHPSWTPLNRAAGAVKTAAASVLQHGADLLERPEADPDRLRAELVILRRALTEMEQSATTELPLERGPVSPAEPPGPDGAADPPAVEARISEFITSLDPSFRAQELSFAVRQIATNIDVAAAAERRHWVERLVGRQPAGVLSAAQERSASYVQRHSVWLHNSVRGAVGLGLAVLVASLTGVEHSFWVVLGTLSVLRSNALSTGQNVVRGLLGTVVGFVIGAGVLALIGTNTTLLWLLLPLAILLAGFAPAAISFAAGQAAFTLTLVILFNIVQPSGWRVGLLRVEDIALGCAVSLFVGLLFWPRGAGAALGRALASSYTDSVVYLARSVEFGMARCDAAVASRPAPSEEAIRAAGAARRLDDAFRGYLSERGAKPVPLPEMIGLVTGVAALRLAADAVLDMWRRDDQPVGGDRAAARHELLEGAALVAAWYDRLAASLIGHGDVPDPLTHDRSADQRLIEAVRHDLRGDDGRANATAVRMIWTGDHLDAARRLQELLVGPARTTVEQGALMASSAAPGWRRSMQRPQTNVSGDAAR